MIQTLTLVANCLTWQPLPAHCAEAAVQRLHNLHGE